MSHRETSAEGGLSIRGMLFIALLAILVRLALAYAIHDSFFERGNRYHTINLIAKNLLQGEGFGASPGNPTGDNEPGYVLFVTAVYAIFGKHWLGIALTQSCISVAGGFVIAQITKQVSHNSEAASYAFVICCFYPFFITQSVSVVDTVLFSVLLALAVLCTVTSIESGGARQSVALGVIWGLCLLTRFGTLCVIPFLGLLLLLRFGYKRGVIAFGFVLLGCSLTLLPWAARNHALAGKWFVTTHGAIEIWFGYNSETKYHLVNDISVDRMRSRRFERLPELRVIADSASERTAIQSEVLKSEVFLQAATQYAMENPLQCAAMLPLKFSKFWSWRLNPTFTSKNAQIQYWWPTIYTLSYLPILVTAIVGLSLSDKKHKGHLVILAMILAFTSMHTVVYGFTRLRLPIDQFLIVYSSIAIVATRQFVFKIGKNAGC